MENELPPDKIFILEILTEAGFISPLRGNAYQVIIPIGNYKRGDVLFLDGLFFYQNDIDTKARVQ